MKKDSSWRDNIYIGHILKSISDIEIFLKKTKDSRQFKKDELLLSGVMRKLEIIGEASKRLSPQFKRKTKHIPWKEICGMRDKLIHDYVGVDLLAVWKTAKKDTQELKETLKKFYTKPSKKCSNQKN